MPVPLAAFSGLYGFAYALWPILWIVFAALWLYNLSVDIGNFDLLRRWMSEHASGDPCVQAILVAFCFGALLEGTSRLWLSRGRGGISAPRPGLHAAQGRDPRPDCQHHAGGIRRTGNPHRGVGRSDRPQPDEAFRHGGTATAFPFLDPARLPGFGGRRRQGIEEGMADCTGRAERSFALAQFVCSNYWGPYAADIVAAMFSTACVIGLLRVWKPASSPVIAGAAKAGIRQRRKRA